MPSTIGVKRHNILKPHLAAALEAFFGFQDWQGLYLTGGTCIAEFYFGHRLSIDIDLFTQDREIYETARRVLLSGQCFPAGTVQSRRTFPEFNDFLLSVPGSEPIKIDLVLDQPPAQGEKIKCGPIWIDSLPDLVSNKLGCVISRSEIKDYLDLFYLLPTIDLPVSELIKLGQNKDAGLDALILAEQLQFIQQAKEPQDLLLANIPWKQIQYYFRHLREELLDLIWAT